MKTLFKCLVLALLVCSFASCNKCHRYDYILRDLKNPAASIPCYANTNSAKPLCYLSPETKIYTAKYEGYGDGPLMRYRLARIYLYDREDPVYVHCKHVFRYEPRGYREVRTVHLLNKDYEYNHTFEYYPIYKDKKLKYLSYKLYHRTYPVRTVQYGNVYEIELENGVKGYIPAKYLQKNASKVYVFHQSYKHNKLAQLGIPILTTAVEKYERLLTSDFCYTMSRQYNFLYAIIVIILMIIVFKSLSYTGTSFLDRVMTLLIFILAIAALCFQFIALDVVAKGVRPIHSVYFDFIEWVKLLDWLGQYNWGVLVGLLGILLILTIIGYSFIIAFYTILAAIGLFVLQGVIPVLTYTLMAPTRRFYKLRKTLSVIGVGAMYLMVILTAQFYPENIDATTMRLIISICCAVSAAMSLGCMLIGLSEKKWLSVLYLTQPFVALLAGIVMYEYVGWLVTIILYIVGSFVAMKIFVESQQYDYAEDDYGNKIPGKYLDDNTFRDTDFNIYKRRSPNSDKLDIFKIYNDN